MNNDLTARNNDNDTQRQLNYSTELNNSNLTSDTLEMHSISSSFITNK